MSSKRVDALEASVPEVGRVTFVAPVVVKVSALAPEVVKSAAKVRLPVRSIVRSASFTSILNVRSAVSVSFGFSIKALLSAPKILNPVCDIDCTAVNS